MSSQTGHGNAKVMWKNLKSKENMVKWKWREGGTFIPKHEPPTPYLLITVVS